MLISGWCFDNLLIFLKHYEAHLSKGTDQFSKNLIFGSYYDILSQNLWDNHFLKNNFLEFLFADSVL